MGQKIQWDKDELRIVIDNLENLDHQVTTIRNAIDGKRNCAAYKEDLRALKDVFKSESKRLQRERGSLSNEEKAFYRPAVQGGLCHLPNLGRPREWHSSLYEVGIDVGYYKHDAKELLESL